MARPLRIEYENACYHVINRGNRRERVFSDDSDCELFMEKLVEFSELYDILIHSYCLMPNHYHLQIRTPLGNLSKFMQSFQTSFTLSMNRKHQSSGHLFQGRFKAQLVESELYKNKLSRYIHLNPVKIKACDELSSETIKSRLIEYKWSSYRYYVGFEKKPKWLERRFVLSSSWGNSASEKMDNYRKYVEEGIKHDNSTDIIASKNGIIGSGKFSENIINTYLKHDVDDLDPREQPLLATINSFSFNDVLTVVKEYYSIKDTEKMTVRRKCHPDARRMAMFLVAKHCRRKETLTSLAKKFGIKISGFNSAIEKFKNNLKHNSSFQKKLHKIEKNIGNKKRKTEGPEDRRRPYKNLNGCPKDREIKAVQ